MMNLCVLFILLIVTTKSTDSLECYTCSDISSINNCLSTTLCRAGQSCFTNSVTSDQSTKYTLGCTNNEQCGVQSSIVGRGIGERATQCHECCSTERCNNQLCVHFKPTTCIDDPKVDCAYMNAMFNICKDVQHSKSVCPKFCGLCSLVDGNWAEWSQWSACDVTCEKGLQTRKRTCTDPAPANNGLDCVGNDTDTKECVKQLCPVHGGWARWSGWGQCSATCDIGIQKRNRNCTNPYPSRYGDHCFGESMDDKLCMPGPCAIPNVVFNAYYLTDLSPTIGQTMIFTKNLVNEGDAYNNATGEFTAPIDGTYSFAAQICFNAQHLYFTIKVGGTIYASVHGYDADYYECSSLQTAARVRKNEKVIVEWTGTSYTANYIMQNTYYRNYFTGTLIHPQI